MAKKQQSRSRQRNDDYDNSNTGVLFRNNKKKNENHPDMRGSFTDENGNEFWLSAWSKEHEKYGKYLSIVATPKEDEQATRKGSRNHGDDLPF